MSLLKNIFKAKEQRSLIDDVVDYGVGAGFNIQLNKGSKHALALSAIYAAVELISNSIAQLPVKIKHKNHTEDKELVSHYLEFVFNNGKIKKFNLLKCMISDCLLYGNGYAYINRAPDGKPTSLRYLPTKSVTVNYNPIKDDLTYTCSLVSAKVINSADIIHIYKDSSDGVTGQGILSYAQRTVDLCNHTDNAVLNYWEKGLHKFGILHAKEPMTPKQSNDALKLVEGDSQLGKDNYIKFLPFDLNFESMSSNASDSQMIETRNFNITEIARYFNISPVLLGDLSHTSYNTIEASNLEFLIHTLSPIISMINEELNRKLVSHFEPGVYIELDTAFITKADKNSTATYLKNLVESGIFCINEARATLGYAPIENGDAHIIAYTNLNNNNLDVLNK